MKTFKLMFVMLVLSGSVLAQQEKFRVVKTIDEYVKTQMRETGAPGMAVAVIKDGRILHCKSYGIANIEYNLPVHTHTAFAIASVTKLFTSTLVMKWMQEEKIGLEDSLERYIGQVPPAWKGIRIKHLLAHESGIPWPDNLGGYKGVLASGDFSVDSMHVLIEKLKKFPLTFETGSRQAYANGDYFVLQYVLEKIGGKPFEQVLKEQVLLPLGMTDSGYDAEMRSFPYQTMYPLANKSQNFTTGTSGPLIFKGYYAPTSYNAAGLYVSIADAVKWAAGLDRYSLLNKHVQEEMTKSSGKGKGFTQLGWTIQLNKGHLVVGHSGGPGLGDIVRLPEQKLTVIVLSNFADMVSYMALAIAKQYVNALELPQQSRMFKRNLVR